MTDRLFIKPRQIDGAAAVIPDPVTGQPLKAEGDGKPRSSFWLRRLRDGDVIEFDGEVKAMPEMKVPPRRTAINPPQKAAPGEPSPAAAPAIKS